jgi:4a-hydroxytetrahydrobiopterin dehydratase
MQQLVIQNCVACREGEVPLSDEEATQLLAQVPSWHIVDRDDMKRLENTFRFDNFTHALAFTNRVGDLAEMQAHHPLIITEWGKVTVAFWTHAIGGLHLNDFIMAARTDQAFASAEGRLN